jgi:sRNA-binding regulator protein Hfq
MSSNSSVIYSIGTALRRAQDSETPVQILVNGEWLGGNVVAVDGHGVVLNSRDDLEHAVVRLESVCAVRVFSPPPVRPRIAAGPIPMSAPRAAS